VALRIGHAMNTNVSPIVWSLGGAFAGIVVVVALYRLTLAFSVAAIGAVAAMLIATVAAETGLVDVGTKPVIAALSSANDAPPSSEPSSTASALTLPAGSNEALASQLDQVSPGLGAPIIAWLDRCQTFLRTVGDWTESRWEAMPKPMRTLLLASAAAGAFIGFFAGLASPVWAAATLTSLFGSLLVLACGLPLASRVVPPESMPKISTMGWLCMWLALAITGWMIQWKSRAKKERPRVRSAEQTEPSAA
jgi:hypothetical protein